MIYFQRKKMFTVFDFERPSQQIVQIIHAVQLRNY